MQGGTKAVLVSNNLATSEFSENHRAKHPSNRTRTGLTALYLTLTLQNLT